MNIKIISGSLLVAGTAIGAGMLALPVATSLGGVWPSCLIYLLCWLFMAATGLLLLEVCLWLPNDANLVSMGKHLLGRSGKMINWGLYLFLFYCLSVAYIAGGGAFVKSIFNESISTSLAMLIFTVSFGFIVYLGTRAVDRVNVIFMIGLILSYLVFVILGSPYIKLEFLKGGSLFQALLAMPIVFTSFSYQGIIPSLTSYLKKDAKAVRLAILIGTAIPFIIYVLWQCLILGIVPVEGAGGLLEAKAQEKTSVFPLKTLVPTSGMSIYFIGQAFAFFALTTSFLGVTLGLIDFLADGLKKKKEGWNGILLSVLVFIPPLLIAIAKPGAFLTALGYAGGIGCALLLGLMPICMVWSGRYRKRYGEQAQLFGGKVLLVLLGAFVLLEVAIEIYGIYTATSPKM